MNIISVILVVGLLLITIAICLYNKNLNKIKEWTYDFIVDSEQTITGTAKGQERMLNVIKRIRELLPWYLKLIFTEGVLKSIIQFCFDILKSTLK